MRRACPTLLAAFLAASTLSALIAGRAAAVPPPGGGTLAVAIDRSGPLQGDVVRVELRGIPSPDNAAIHWKGRAWPMRACGEGCFEALAGIDVAEATGRHTLSVLSNRSGAALRADVELEVAERPFPVQSFTVPKDKDAQEDALLLERIGEEAKALRARFDAAPSAPAWISPFLPPVPGFTPRNFGSRRVINEEPRSPHTGGDMTLPEGTPVNSVADGRVVFSGEQFFGGNEVVVDHGGGVFSMYFHMSERAVAEGQAVRRGDRIGAVGSTGRATGPHLHFGLRVTGARVDPAALPGIVDNR